MPSPITIIAAPTAAGKSALALQKARETGGIIINADSMQVYQGLPVLSAQPTVAEQQEVPHYLYGYISPLEACSVARWRRDALACLEQAQQQERPAFVVGGTGLYLRALLSGLAPVPDIPADVRQAVKALYQQGGTQALAAALHREDALMASRLQAGDTQRLARALEVVRATGTSLALWQQKPGIPLPWAVETLVLLPLRELLYQRINHRLEQMLEHGALEEVQAFPEEAHFFPAGKTLGLAEFRAYLSGFLSLPDALVQAQQKTRQYAKRQYTWFRRGL